MDARSEHDQDGRPDALFVTEADWIPGFWNYLLDLDRNDLIAELIQNDLDQDATRTVISFERDHLTCEGNGRPVEPEGWQRLRKIQGAGDSVPAKSGKIGVKNHGLKTAFTIGDEIRLMSDGQVIIQTLHAKGRGKPPHPGASPNPVPDPGAPAAGCLISIRYRDAPIEPPQGEASVLSAITAQEIDKLFLSACATAPEQFAGIVSPDVVPRYGVVLRHWRLGEAHFQFSCTRPRKISRGIELFRRRCNVSGTEALLPDTLQEQAARQLKPLKGRLRKRVADFFRRSDHFFVEVSWPIDRRGRPGTGTGRFRYPIGYPQDSHEARTGHSAYFNAPIASDNKRHGPARNEATNQDLRAACETLLIEVLARHAIPRWGADGLNPLVPSPGAENRDEAIRPLLAALTRRNAMPTLKWREAVEPLAIRKRVKVPTAARRSAGRGTGTPARKYKFVIPVTTWDNAAIHSALSAISPPWERQIHPLIQADLLQLLTDGKTDGFCHLFITFTEKDAFARATGEGNSYFDAPPDLSAEFAQPFIARAYLDLVHDALAHDSCDEQREDGLLDSMRLPDIHGKLARIDSLHTSASLPSDIPGLRLPPLLHIDLISHPIFRRRKWHRQKFTMSRFLESGALRDSDAQTRRQFWKWLRRNEQRISPRGRPKLAEIPIWPDQGGNLCVLSDLCDPRSRRVATAFEGSIRRPHGQVCRSKLVSAGTRGRNSIRRVPTEAEVEEWLDQRLTSLPFEDAAADEATVAKLQRLESDLAILLKTVAISRLLMATDVRLPAIAQDGSIRQRTELVMPSRTVDRLELSGRFLLCSRKNAATLNRLSPSLSEPTAAILVETFSDDSTNFEALQPRLQQFLDVTQPGDDDRDQLAELPIIPINGKPHSPASLAFTNRKGDFWGKWKRRLSSRGLSQEDQRRYRDAGVTSALPNPETSRTFFDWLAIEPEDVLRQHIPCVLRHVLHFNGPRWAEIHTGIPFIPARCREGHRLVSLRMARHRPVFLPDAEEVAEAIIDNDPGVLLVVDQVREVSESVWEPLRNLGIRSLREALKEPESVSGTGETARADVVERLRPLRSNHFRRTFLKRLAALGIEKNLVRHDWHNRVSRIGTIHLADTVESRYRFRRKLYTVPTTGGFDPESGTFWIEKDPDSEIGSLFEVIAAQLVFKPSARPVDCLALERALDLEIRELSYGRPSTTSLDPDGDENAADTKDQDGTGEPASENDSGEDDPGEAVFGHSPFEPDPSRNKPKPRPISPSPAKSPRKSGRAASGPSGGKGSKSEMTPAQEPKPELELEHIESLKRDQYASHCQMCLCERAPQELAPTGSYIQWEEVRRLIVQAHHVDLKSAGGARHAGNLILLCKMHHDNYGRLLSRAMITAALQGKTNERSVTFGVDGHADSEVEGREVTLVIPVSGEAVKVFFNDEHAKYWLENARL